MTLQLDQAKAFYNGPAFQRGYTIADSMGYAIDYIRSVRPFYHPEMFSGGIVQAHNRVKHDANHLVYFVDLRVHPIGDPRHGWDKDEHHRHVGQSEAGLKMAESMLANIEAWQPRGANIGIDLGTPR